LITERENNRKKGTNRIEEKVSGTENVIDVDSMQSIIANVRIFL